MVMDLVNADPAIVEENSHGKQVLPAIKDSEFVICLSLIPLSWADNDNKEKLETLDTGKLDTTAMFDVDNDKENNDAQRKRDPGYFYRRPDRPIKFESLRLSSGPGRYATRFPTNILKPFNRYGPPKQTALHVFLNNHQTSRPHNQRYKNRYHGQHTNDNNIRFSGNNNSKENSYLNVLDSIKGIGSSSGSNPIASQNTEPFNHNTANYLPPKNQKLPIHSSNSNFQQSSVDLTTLQRFNNNLKSQEFIKSSQQLSDASQFLTQNAHAISQLYKTPAANINYEPTSDEIDAITNNQSPNPNSQFQTFDLTTNQQSQLQQNTETLISQQKLPLYSSGIIGPYRTLEKIIAEEKDRLIHQLQQKLSSQSSSDSDITIRYAQNNGNYYDTQKLLFNKLQNQDEQNAFNIANTAAIKPASTQPDTLLTSYGVPVHSVTNHQTPSTISLTASAVSNSASVNRPQSTSSAGNSHVLTSVSTPSTQPAATFPFPQYDSFVPTIIGNTNFVSGLPPHYDSTFIATNPPNSPTHFTIPIGITNVNKPILGSIPPTSGVLKPISFPSIPSTPLSISPVNSLFPNPIQPVFPNAPTLTPLQKPIITNSHPSYGVQPTPVTSVILRPVKPVYPVYYYPNAAYHLQKPALTLSTYPKLYSPTHLQTKPNQSCK
ncbi:hypothetical protein PV327_006831 [Microctonus hyperodae]|uniref:Uncharacterized protein n=1 Tax=Microctonus hyperodae TaxID=165561 RepID=A0AA39F577_MICHY|nr:hypothetical protein PV327_006831 [Microctonus hyperodae]